MHIHGRKLLRAADEVARRSGGENQSLSYDTLAMSRHRHDRAGAGLGDRAERLLHDVRESTALVPWRSVGAAVGRASREVIVIPLHLTNQRAGHVFIHGPRRQQMNRVADFRYFAEHHGCAGTHQEVGRKAGGRIAGDAGKRIATAALQADDQIRCGTGNALAIVQLLHPLLGRPHDRGDGFAEPAFVLHADDVEIALPHRK